MATIPLFVEKATNGSSVVFKPAVGSIETTNRKSYLDANGVLGGASLVLEQKDPAGNWHTTGRSDEIKLITDFPGVFIIGYADELLLRLTIVGADAETNISIWANNVDEIT